MNLDELTYSNIKILDLYNSSSKSNWSSSPNNFTSFLKAIPSSPLNESLTTIILTDDSNELDPSSTLQTMQSMNLDHISLNFTNSSSPLPIIEKDANLDSVLDDEERLREEELINRLEDEEEEEDDEEEEEKKDEVEDKDLTDKERIKKILMGRF